MADKSYNEIPDLNEDWGFDPRNGLKYSGQSVQEFIKAKLQEAQATADEKVCCFHWDVASLTVYGFTSEERKQLYLDTGDAGYIDATMPMEFTGTQQQVKVIDRSGGKNLYFTTTQDSAVLTVGFVSQQKGVTDSEWEEIYEDFTVSVFVDRGFKGSWTTVASGVTVLNGNTYSIDVMKYLATGANRVKFTAVGNDTGKVGTTTYTANLTTMYLSPSNFAWNNAFVEGTDYNLGGVNIGGNLSKVLKVLVTNEELGYEQLYEESLSTATYITNAYFYKGMEFPSTGTGTYHVEMWLDADGLESDHLHYNIMCVASADADTAQLVCINDIATDATNGTDAVLAGYAVYNGSASTASPSYEVTKDGAVIASDTLQDVATQAKQSLTVSLEEETEEASFSVGASVTMGDYTQSITVSIDNSMSFPAVKGAVFYMNAATRNNAQANRESIVNEVDGTEYAITSSNIAYVDKTDGHTVDENGRKCLLVPAGGNMTFPYRPMATIGTGWTFEMFYKVSNAADYEENILTIATNPTDANFQGIRIKPKNVCLHSRNLNTDDLAQSYNTKDEEYVHLVITLVKNYKTNYGNLAQIYVNGVKKTSFAFTGTDSFAHTASLILGSQTADLCVYKMRVYNQGFGWQDAMQNYINCLSTQAEKIEAYNRMMSILDDSYNVSYDKVVGVRNTMVIRMRDGAVLPSNLYPAGGKCDVTFNCPDVIASELDEDFTRFFSGMTIENETIEPQGTTAMTYYRQNFRWKLSSAYNKRRITAKKNVASSMHSHKMGATRMYNDLFQKVCGGNEVGKRVAVWQVPVYAFLEELVDGTEDQYTYTFIGLYTVGPDKGDKPTFGFDEDAYEASLMHLEGTDHTPLSVGYDYPWEWTAYSSSKEAMGAVTATGDIAAAWEVGAAGGLEPDSADDQTAVQAMLDSEFRPAYDAVYNNSTCILGVTETLDDINADATAWRKNTTDTGKSYSELEFYTHGVYDLYCYNQQEGIFKATGVNVLTDLGLTADDVSGMDAASTMEYIKGKRRERFMADFPTYWVLDDALFHDVFLVLFGGSDNFKKNNYPYKFALIADGGQWRKRQDDLDSIYDINNQGFAAKLYSILLGDKTSTGSGSVFRGENSILTILLDECYPTEKKAMAHRIFDAMAELSPYGQSKIEKLVGYVQYCCWDWAQDYFTKSAYNTDAEWTYEEAWPLHTSGVYVNDVNPLAQSQGDHYEAERDWIALRMVFMASYYNWGPFAADNGDDKSTGQISYRAASGKTFTIVPALDHNPTILLGQSDVFTAGGRIKAGESCEVTVAETGSNDTHVYIQGVDYLADLGDLCDLQVSADNPDLVVASKRLQKLKVGDETAENVTSNVKNLEIGSCPCLEEVDARNLSSLQEEVNLTLCPRLKKAHFSGTSAKEIAIAEGSKVEELSLPSTLTTLSFVKLLNLTEDNLVFDDLGNLAYLRLENNAQMDGWEMLKNAYTNSSALANIRVVGFDYEGDATDVDMIADFATGVDDTGTQKYYGIDADGNATEGLPVLDGNLTVTTPVYEESLNILKQYYPNLNVDADTLYMRFQDPEVLSVLLANGVGDDVGITQEQAEAVTSIGTWFKGNTAIESFDEFEKFIGVKSVDANAFNGDANLESITFNAGITSIGSSAFKYCALLNIDVHLPQLTTLGLGAFNASGIKSFKADILESFSGDNSSNSTFVNCKNLTTVDLPSIKSIGKVSFYGCTSLSQVNISTAESIGTGAFNGCTSLGGVMNLPNLVGTLPLTVFLGTAITSFIAPKLTGIQGDNANNSAFTDCNSLQEVRLDSIQTIGRHVFQNRTSLERIKINTVSEIGGNAFYGCTSLELEDLNLPNLETLGQNAFYGVKIKKLVLGSDGTALTLPTASTSTQNYGDKSVLEEVVLPDTITNLPNGSFFQYTNLVFDDLNLPNLETIGGGAFYGTKVRKISSLGNVSVLPGASNSTGYLFQGCTELTEVSQSVFDKIVTIKGQPFADCVNLYIDELRMPNLENIAAFGNGVHIRVIRDLGKITTLFEDLQLAVGHQAFGAPTYIEGYHIPMSVQSIGRQAFLSMSNLQYIICNPVTPPTLNSNSGLNSSTCPIYVPDESVTAYREASGWVDYADRIKAISELATDNPDLYEEIAENL